MFYDWWQESDEDYYGPKPVTLEQKIEFGMNAYSGDSGVSPEELERYLRDLIATAKEEG